MYIRIRVYLDNIIRETKICKILREKYIYICIYKEKK